MKKYNKKWKYSADEHKHFLNKKFITLLKTCYLYSNQTFRIFLKSSLVMQIHKETPHKSYGK